MNPQSSFRAIVAASGSGGHLVPALLIARGLLTHFPGATVEFVGSGRPLEEKLVDRGGFKRHVISITGVKSGGILGIFKFCFALPRATIQTYRLLKRFKPDVVVGVGGYVSVLPVLIAKLLGIKTWIHEAELAPGMANGFLARFADTVSIAFKDAKMPHSAKTFYTGHPARKEITEVDTTAIREGAPKHLLVMGGSQGAKALDKVLPLQHQLLKSRGISVRHQCRADGIEGVSKAYKEHGIEASVFSFIDNMGETYSWADVIVSRAGANSVLEVALVNRPAIFVPYPFQQGTHQTDNAKTLAGKGKALIVEEGENFEQRFGAALEELLNPEEFLRMKNAPGEKRAVNATDAIVEGIARLVGTI